MTTEPTSTGLVVREAASVELTRKTAREGRTRRRRIVAALVGLGAVVVVAGVVAVGMMSGWLLPGGSPMGDLAGGSGSGIRSFSVTPEAAECQSDRGTSSAPLSFSWDASGAERAWIGEGTSDASESPLAEVPVSADAWTDVAFPCHLDEVTYTLTVEGADGKSSASVTVTRSSE